jgi:hypothetical protein
MIANDLEERFRKLRRESSAGMEALESEVKALKDEVCLSAASSLRLMLSARRLSETDSCTRIRDRQNSSETRERSHRQQPGRPSSLPPLIESGLTHPTTARQSRRRADKGEAALGGEVPFLSTDLT